MRKVLFWTLIFLIIFFIFLILRNYLQVSIYPCIKELKCNQILRTKEGYNALETKHFYIMHKNEENFAHITGEVLEKYYAQICKKFKYFPNNKAYVILYDNERELLGTVDLGEECSIVGAYYGGTIHILSPTIWIDDKKNVDKIYRETTPAIHEFVHLLIDEKTNGNYPLWLTEGIALYIENITTGFEWNEGVGETSNVTLKELNEDFSSIEQGVAYRKSYEIVTSLVDCYGFDKINLLLDNLGGGKSIENSVKAALKIRFKDIN